LHLLILGIFFIPVLLSGVYYLYAYFFLKTEATEENISPANPNQQDREDSQEEYDDEEYDCDFPADQASLLLFMMFGIVWLIQAAITSVFFYWLSPHYVGVLLIHLFCLISIIVLPGMWQTRQFEKTHEKFIHQQLSAYLCQLSWGKTMNLLYQGDTITIATFEELDQQLDQLEIEQGEVAVVLYFYSSLQSLTLLHTRLGRPDTVLVYWNTDKKPHNLVAVGNNKSQEKIKLHSDDDDEWTYLTSHLISHIFFFSIRI